MRHQLLGAGVGAMKDSNQVSPTTTYPIPQGRLMRCRGELRYVAMGPGALTLEQAWGPADGGQIEWRPVPILSRKEAGYAE